MITLDTIDALARPHCLAVFGALHPGAEDGAPGGTGTIVLIGPSEPGFWPLLTASGEWRDGAPDPVDRWSKRVIGALAEGLGGTAIFPSDGPPYAPFFRWALVSGRAWASPVGMLVHAEAGLMISFRGAVRIAGAHLPLPRPAPNPCESCAERPCRTACPVDALSPGGYAVAACRAYLETPPGADCLSRGCAARRACPVSRSYGRLEAQSAFHMRAFR